MLQIAYAVLAVVVAVVLGRFFVVSDIDDPGVDSLPRADFRLLQPLTPGNAALDSARVGQSG
jgi:hypothetical protein